MQTKLVYIIPTMDLGGAEKQLCLLAENLPRDRFDVHVLLLTRDGPRSEGLRRSGIPVTVIGKRFKADVTALNRLRRELVRIRPDIVHTWLFAANSFGRVAARLAKVPRIFASERCVDLWKSPAHFWLDRRLARYSEAITTNSAGVKNFYADHGLPASKFSVIPNAIEPRRATESSGGASISRNEAFDRLKVSPSQKLVLAVGRLWPQKRYRDLIWAAELLATLREDLTLVIVGDGPQRAELMRFRDSVTSIDRVRFAGNRQDVQSLLPHASQFWIGSEYEGQSNSLIEAMQVGLPIVASDIPGNRDLIRDQETGRLYPVGDMAALSRASQWIFENRDQAERLGLAAKEKIDTDFTIESMVRDYVELYEG